VFVFVCVCVCAGFNLDPPVVQAMMHPFLCRQTAKHTHTHIHTHTSTWVHLACVCEGFNLDPPVVQAMMHRHDPDNDTQMKLDDFIRM